MFKTEVAKPHFTTRSTLNFLVFFHGSQNHNLSFDFRSTLCPGARVDIINLDINSFLFPQLAGVAILGVGIWLKVDPSVNNVFSVAGVSIYSGKTQKVF